MITLAKVCGISNDREADDSWPGNTLAIPLKEI